MISGKSCFPFNILLSVFVLKRSLFLSNDLPSFTLSVSVRSDLEPGRREEKRERESPERVTFPACRVSHTTSLCFTGLFFPRFYIPLHHEKTHSSQERRRGVTTRWGEQKETESRRYTSSEFTKKTVAVAVATVWGMEEKDGRIRAPDLCFQSGEARAPNSITSELDCETRDRRASGIWIERSGPDSFASLGHEYECWRCTSLVLLVCCVWVWCLLKRPDYSAALSSKQDSRPASQPSRLAQFLNSAEKVQCMWPFLTKPKSICNFTFCLSGCLYRKHSSNSCLKE